MKKAAFITAILTVICCFMSGVHAQWHSENLNRGLVAVKTDGGVYLSWRLHENEDSLFGSAAENVTFEIYKNGELLGTNENNTNYIDASGTVNDEYYVVDADGKESEKVNPYSANYFDIPLVKPADAKVGNSAYPYVVGDASCGDLDGDGEYEIVIKWEANPMDNANSGYTGHVLFDAYKLNGERLWEDYIDLGMNIREGAHYTQFLVYDFDMDGKAEITCKTAPASKDAKGNFVSQISNVGAIKNTDNTVYYGNSGGRILDGDEFFTIFDGETGKALDTIYYPNQRVDMTVWGDNYGNRCDRFTATVAWLDGERPYAFYMRGYYFGDKNVGREAACAISFDGEKLECKYSFDTYDTNSYADKGSSSSYNNGVYKGVYGYEAGNERYRGNGNHNCAAMDVNGDGRDEVTTGSLCYTLSDDNKLVTLWCTYLGHGDALHVGAYDPTREGKLDLFVVHEEGEKGKLVYDPVTGEVPLDFGLSLIHMEEENGTVKTPSFHVSGADDTGRGIMANVGLGGYYQMFTSDDSEHSYISYGNNVYGIMPVNPDNEASFRVFWDGDLYDEMLNYTCATSWDSNGQSKRVFEGNGVKAVNGTKRNPAVSADLFGDWREEICYPLSDDSALRIYTTNIYTDYKMKSLMYDRVYRNGVSAEQAAYNQPPHIGYYVDEAMFKGGITDIKITKLPAKTEYVSYEPSNYKEYLDLTGIEVTATFGDGTSGILTGYTVTGYEPFELGEQAITVSAYGYDAEDTFNVTVTKTAPALNASVVKSKNKYSISASPEFCTSGELIIAFKNEGKLIELHTDNYIDGKYDTEIECEEKIDEIFIALWDSLSSMKPVCAAERIGADDWKVENVSYKWDFDTDDQVVKADIIPAGEKVYDLPVISGNASRGTDSSYGANTIAFWQQGPGELSVELSETVNDSLVAEFDMWVSNATGRLYEFLFEDEDGNPIVRCNFKSDGPGDEGGIFFGDSTTRASGSESSRIARYIYRNTGHKITGMTVSWIKCEVDLLTGEASVSMQGEGKDKGIWTGNVGAGKNIKAFRCRTIDPSGSTNLASYFDNLYLHSK